MAHKVIPRTASYQPYLTRSDYSMVADDCKSLARRGLVVMEATIPPTKMRDLEQQYGGAILANLRRPTLSAESKHSPADYHAGQVTQKVCYPQP
jgi:hypothetical protein